MHTLIHLQGDPNVIWIDGRIIEINHEIGYTESEKD